MCNLILNNSCPLTVVVGLGDDSEMVVWVSAIVVCCDGEEGVLPPGDACVSDFVACGVLEGPGSVVVAGEVCVSVPVVARC